MVDRYARYEELRELAEAAEGRAEYDLAAALKELAQIVLLEREREAAVVLLSVTRRL